MQTILDIKTREEFFPEQNTRNKFNRVDPKYVGRFKDFVITDEYFSSDKIFKGYAITLYAVSTITRNILGYIVAYRKDIDSPYKISSLMVFDDNDRIYIATNLMNEIFNRIANNDSSRVTLTHNSERDLQIFFDGFNPSATRENLTSREVEYIREPV